MHADDTGRRLGYEEIALTPRERIVSMARRVIAVERRVSDWLPLTPLGVSIALFAGVVLRLFAYPEMDLVLLVVGYGCLGLVLVAALLVVGGAIRLKLVARRYRGPDQSTLETGRALPTGLSLPS